MEKFGVPCPQCGSVKVVVGGREEPSTAQSPNLVDGHRHVPQVHRCACENCLHTFQHDFAFGG